MQVHLELPEFGAAPDLAGAPASDLTSARIVDLLRRARADVSHRATEGDRASAAARRLLSADEDDLSDFTRRVLARIERGEAEGSARPLGAAEAVYGSAAAAAAERSFGEAGAGLVALLDPTPARTYGLLGLAVCAARLGRFEDALTLSVESFGGALGHPRAYCIAGLCAMKRGDGRAAQSYLSGASRIARRDPAHIDDLRLAQRLLLSMHLSTGQDLAALVDVDPN